MLTETQLRRELEAAEKFAAKEPFGDPEGNAYHRGVAKGLKVALTGEDMLTNIEEAEDASISSGLSEANVHLSASRFQRGCTSGSEA